MFILAIFAIIIVAGVIAAIAAGFSKQRLLKFKVAEVTPLYRCPGTPIDVQFAAEGPVKVLLNGKEVYSSPSGSETIQLRSDDLDRAPQTSTITLEIIAPSGDAGDSRDFTIETFKIERPVTRPTVPLDQTRQPFPNSTFNFAAKISPEVWDKSLVVTAISLVAPQTTYQNSYTSPPSSVELEYQYEKGLQVSGILNSKNGFTSNVGMPTEGPETWIISALPIPTNLDQVSARSVIIKITAPVVAFTIKCTK
jgi:hypothetical protein